MDALAVVIREILIQELRSNLAFTLTLIISMQLVFQTPDCGKILLIVSQNTTQNLDSLAVAVREISSHQLRSNSDFFLTLSIFTPFVVQIPGYGKMLLNVSQNTTQNLDALALVICEISTQELRSNLDIFFRL